MSSTLGVSKTTGMAEVADGGVRAELSPDGGYINTFGKHTSLVAILMKCSQHFLVFSRSPKGPYRRNRGRVTTGTGNIPILIIKLMMLDGFDFA